MGMAFSFIGYVVCNEFRFWLNKTDKKISAENRCKSICSIGAEVSALLMQLQEDGSLFYW